ncbi:MAG: rhomboid family intramembrane serine protease [Bacteroides sp.]|nr:rhomboid family intramembrane serine protease [Bacteroides sp.]MCM1413681.1 rhomboid family intramembrane serine protease [Bacteroides sp.]MCM1471860.1 rhomboid family intramembrane serine protease [Bacteroides sp.]
MTIFNGIKSRFDRLTATMRLVAANALVFVALRLCVAIGRLCGSDDMTGGILSWLEMPAGVDAFLQRPWTIVTYMFVQYDLMHALMNMLLLWMFGSVLDRYVRPRRVIALYLSGGVVGGLCHLLYGLLSGGMSFPLLGASASTLAVMGAAMLICTGARYRLIFFGEASLKVVGLIAILLTVIATGTGAIGVHVAHAGGLLTGLVLGYHYRNARPRVIARPFIPVQRTVDPDFDTSTSSAKSDLDQLLDKIRRSGYASLTDAERNMLFRISSDLQKGGEQQS